MIYFNILDAHKFFDTTWKVVLALTFVIIVFFAIFGLLGKGIEALVKHQGKKVDKMMSPIVLSGLVDDEKDFVKISSKKSKVYFFKTSLIPLLLILIGLLTWIIYHSIDGNWGESIFDEKTGIGTLFWTWDYTNAKYYPPLGFDGIILRSSPHFLTNKSMTNYFVFLFIAVGLIWYLFNVQAYFARFLRIKKLQDTMFSQNLDNIDLATLFSTAIGQKTPTTEKSTESEDKPSETNQSNEGISK